MMPDFELAQSYAFCRRLSRRAHSSFYASFWLLPRAKRPAMHALYAFMRHTDDLGDSSLPVARRRTALQCWRRSLDDALAGRFGAEEADGRPLLAALADTVRRFSIPRNICTP